MRKAQEKLVRIGLVQPVPDNALIDKLKAKEGLEVSLLESGVDPMNELENSKVDAVIVFQSDFAEQLSARGVGKMTLYYRSTGNGRILRGRIMDVVDDYRKEVRESRIQGLGYTLDFINPVHVEFKDSATQQEQIGEAIGGFIPYIFIILAFTGAMYPAIDLGAGEKERGTLETLLTSSAPLIQILMGKLLVTICSGLFAASLSLTSMAIALFSMGSMLGDFPSSIGPMLQPMNIALFFSLLLLLTVFFASFLLALSFFAKSFKEAQSIISPLMAAILFPLIFGMMPWVQAHLCNGPCAYPEYFPGQQGYLFRERGLGPDRDCLCIACSSRCIGIHGLHQVCWTGKHSLSYLIGGRLVLVAVYSTAILRKRGYPSMVTTLSVSVADATMPESTGVQLASVSVLLT